MDPVQKLLHGRGILRAIGYGHVRVRSDLIESIFAQTGLMECGLPFVPSDDGIAPGEAIECFNQNSAVMKAEAVSRKPGHVGAVAFSRSGDPATGDFGDAEAIRKFGVVPGDLSAL